MEKRCTQLSHISEYIHVKPTYIKDKNGPNLTKAIHYIVDLMTNADKQ